MEEEKMLTDLEIKRIGSTYKLLAKGPDNKGNRHEIILLESDDPILVELAKGHLEMVGKWASQF